MVVNHKGAVGEIGAVCSHYTADSCIGVIGHHHMEDAAPEVRSAVDRSLNGYPDEAELAQMLGLWSYPGRGLASTSASDIFLLNPFLKQGIDWIDRHFHRIGLERARKEDIIWDDDFRNMADFKDKKKSFFFFGPQANAVCPDQKRFEMTQSMNEKNEFMELARLLGVPVPKVICFRSKNQVQDCKDLFRHFGAGKVILKISKSVSGLGVVVCRSAEELESEISSLSEGLNFQIQEYLENAEFISIQYGITDGLLFRIGPTGQFFDDEVIHAGNYGSRDFPFRPQVITDRLAQCFAAKGMKGWFGFDIAAVKNNGHVSYRAVECNPRYTGAAYYLIPAVKLGAIFWAGKNYPVSGRLEDLDLRDSEFNPKKGEGWILVNWGPTIKDGKGGFLYVGSPEKFKKSEERLQNLLA